MNNRLKNRIKRRLGAAAGIVVVITICLAMFTVSAFLSLWAGPMNEARLFYGAGFISYLAVSILIMSRGGFKTYYNTTSVTIVLMIALFIGFILHFFKFMDHGSLALHTILGWPAIVSVIILFILVLLSALYAPMSYPAGFIPKDNDSGDKKEFATPANMKHHLI